MGPRVVVSDLLPNQLVDDTVAELRGRIAELEEENRRLRMLRDWLASHFEGTRVDLDPVEVPDLRRLVHNTY